MSRRKGTPCACKCDPCGSKKCIKAINNVSGDPNGDFEIKAGNGIGISQSGDNSITIINQAMASSFVAGDNIEINPSGDNLEIRVTDDISVQDIDASGDVNISGDLNITGDIIQQGAAYETHAEKIYTTNDYIYMREGAVGGLASGSYAGFEVIKYDGTNDGRLVIDNTGTARVGDVGSEQPLLTREESANLNNGALLKWDAANLKAVDEGTVGSDTKPIKIVNGVATPVTYDLERKIENHNIAAITYATAWIGTTGSWINQTGTVNIPSGSPYYSADNGSIKVLESGVYMITARLNNNVSQYEAIVVGNNYSQNSVHNTQISETVYISANTTVKAALYGSANTGSFEQYNGLNRLTIVKL